MRKIVKRTVMYCCGNCHTHWSNKKDALACEGRGVEKRPYKVGDRVRSKQYRRCSCGRKYFCEGRIRKIVGPYPFTIDTQISFGLHPQGWVHYYNYEISSGRCPKCKTWRSARYPSHILKPAPKKR